jgi:hypothetical protein
MGKYQLADVGVDPIANPLPTEGRRLPWFWILMLAALFGCGLTFGLSRLKPAQAEGPSNKVGPTQTRVVEVSSATRTPTASPTPTITPTQASTQTPWVVTREVVHNNQVIQITIQTVIVDHQVVVPQDHAVIVTVKVPWVITQVCQITTTPLPSYTPYPTSTSGPTQTPWIITATPGETNTATLAPPPTETPTITATPTETSTP